MSKQMTVADYFAHFISEKNVPAEFELSGGMIAFLTDSIYRLGKTKIINTRHEQTAGFAAESGSRVSGIPNVAMGTSGPGATNLLLQSVLHILIQLQLYSSQGRFTLLKSRTIPSKDRMDFRS